MVWTTALLTAALLAPAAENELTPLEKAEPSSASPSR